MARRKKIGELKDSETECGYCGAIIPDTAQKCPSCGKWFSSFRKLMAFTIVVIIVVAGMSYFTYTALFQGEESYIPVIKPIDLDDTETINDGKTIIFELYESQAPNTCENIKRYVQDGFYDGLIFHRVIDGFMIQGGGFNPDLSQKPPTYPPIDLEIAPGLNHQDGSVAMARTTDPNSATSQFYICDGPQSSLDGQYAVFGKVVRGMEVVRAISAVSTQSEGMHDDVPVNDVIIQSMSLGTSDGKTYVSMTVDF